MAGEKQESQKVEEELKPENENEDEEPTVEEELKEKQSDSKRMKPWEQHAAVINLPRFDYNAPSALLQRSYSGFLVTCSISAIYFLATYSSIANEIRYLHSIDMWSCVSYSKLTCFYFFFSVVFLPEREKSATKEVMSILDKVCLTVLASGIWTFPSNDCELVMILCFTFCVMAHTCLFWGVSNFETRVQAIYQIPSQKCILS